MTKDWESRLSEACDSENFRVLITASGLGLTDDEYDRLQPKLRLIEQFALRLAQNMVKGTIKYIHDDRSVEEWLGFEDDDYADAVNYRLLRQEAQEAQKVRNGS